MSSRARTALALAALTASALSPSARAASRPLFGGTATLAYAGEPVSTDPLLADAPAEAALLGLSTSGLCRDTPSGAAPLLAQALTRPAPDRLELTLAPGLQGRAGAPLTALDVATAWARVFTERSPYRALFAPVRGGEAAIRGAAHGRDRLSLPLAYAWPDLERSLCHPALSVTVPAGFGSRSGLGPFTSSASGNHQASPTFPAGRPFLDRLRVSAVDERGAARALGLGRAQLALDGDPGVAGPMRFATYLLFRPERVGPDFRARVLGSLDRADLVRLFVRAPAAPLTSLLPGASAPPLPPSAASPARPSGPELTLVYDRTLDSQRAVAERISLKLHDRGYPVKLLGVTREELRARWAKGTYDLMLHPVLLPAEDGPALAVALTLAGRESLLPRELPPIGALADPAARGALARERAAALTAEGTAIPLFVQGVRLRVAPNVSPPPLDALGVPALAGASVALEGQLAPAGGPPDAR